MMYSMLYVCIIYIVSTLYTVKLVLPMYETIKKQGQKLYIRTYIKFFIRAVDLIVKKITHTFSRHLKRILVKNLAKTL